MEKCWLCPKSFQSKTDLVAHLVSREHRRQTVICPWCGEKKTFTRVSDLAVHCGKQHFVELGNLPKSFLTARNCFYFAVYPQDYARLHEPEAWGSPLAVEARRLVLKMIEGLKDGLVKRDNWRAGWRVAAQKQKKENVDTPLDLSKKTVKRKAENETTTSKKVCDDKNIEKETPVFKDLTKVTQNSEETGKKKERVRFRCSRLSESSEEDEENVVEDMLSYEEETLTATKLIEQQIDSVTELHDKPNDIITKDQEEITKRTVKITPDMTTKDHEETIQQEAEVTNEDPEVTKKEVDITHTTIDQQPEELTQGEITIYITENESVPTTVPEEIPQKNTRKDEIDSNKLTESIESKITNDRPQETTNEPAAPTNSKNLTYKEKAIDLLKTGAMPMVPPGRREWKEGASFHIHLHGCDFTWPPQDWEKMSSDRRLMAWEHTAFQIEYLQQGSLSPTLSRSFLLDKYNFLALPGSGKVKRENSEKGSAKSRFYLYQVLKEVANTKEPSDAEKAQIDSLMMIRKDDELNRQLRSLEIPLRLF